MESPPVGAVHQGGPPWPATTPALLGARAARHPPPAGPVPPRGRGKSQGRWKAVVVGLVRARRPCRDRAAPRRARRLLRRAGARAAARQLARRRRRAAAEAHPRPRAPLPGPAEKAGPLARYAATIQSQRGDYNGRVLSIRQDDLRTLAVIYDESPSVLTEQLISWGVLTPTPAAPSTRRAAPLSAAGLLGGSRRPRRRNVTSCGGTAAGAPAERHSRRLAGPGGNA